ncbi:MAG TPA: KilA-N domain-containing protein [Flavobacteriales bacterium]|nr:KilA-N domain-containing protein [Flavobacteriales bacterium]HMR27279.1 KilA-N domain-containing protein [Flavobacteriales bacterium]
MKNRTITVKDTEVAVTTVGQQDYISLTDMLKAKEGDVFIGDWLRNRNTVEFLGIWESVHNPDFNYGGFATIRSEAGLNRFRISVKDWVEQTNAIGLRASAGRYGGTYAHPDIAFEFGMWISPEFKVYLVKEFRRLKEAESGMASLEWNLQRTLAKVNYRIHTDAIKEHLIPPVLGRDQTNRIYSSEADLLNMALFGMTAAEWRNANPTLPGNMRDHATLEQLVVLSNMESINALLIRQGLDAPERLRQLNGVAITQMRSLLSAPVKHAIDKATGKKR